MANVMRSVDFRAVVSPILNEVFDSVYEQRANEYEKYLESIQGIPRNYHEEVALYGLEAAPELPDGTPVTYSTGGVLYITRAVYRVYGLAYALTKVLVEDSDAVRIGSIYARHLAQSMMETKETLAANLLNQSFSSAAPIGDGQPLCSTVHPIAGGQTFSNILGTPAALSQTSLEQALIQIRAGFLSNEGRRIRVTPKKLLISPSNIFQAEAILKSTLRSGSSDNDINPVKSLNYLSEGAFAITRLTSSKAWWVMNDVPHGLQIAERRKLEKSMEGDFESDSMRYKATERYVIFAHDPRIILGTPGL